MYWQILQGRRQVRSKPQAQAQAHAQRGDCVTLTMTKWPARQKSTPLRILMPSAHFSE